MVTTISVRGQVVIPVKLRKKYHIRPTSKLEWIDTGNALSLFPIPDNPVKSSRGMLKGTRVTTTALLKARKEGKKMEDKKWSRTK